MLRFAPNARLGIWGSQHAELFNVLVFLSTCTRIDLTIDNADAPACLRQDGVGYGLAFDVNTEGKRLADLLTMHRWLGRWLPHGWEVVREEDHLHIEYDRQLRSAPPPAPGTSPL